MSNQKPPQIKGGFLKKRGVVNDVRTAIERQNEYIHIPDFTPTE